MGISEVVGIGVRVGVGVASVAPNMIRIISADIIGVHSSTLMLASKVIVTEEAPDDT